MLQQSKLFSKNKTTDPLEFTPGKVRDMPLQK